jgi:hypothetical protein
MANNMTTFLADKLLNHTLRNTAYVQPATVYVSLHTSNPGKAGSHAAEVSGGSYTRTAVTFGAPSTNGSYEETKNTLVTFPTATADWGTVTHIGIEDASTAGNMLFYGPLTVSKTVQNGDTFSLPLNSIVVDLG